MKKILVLGIRGMAGHVIFKKLQYNTNYIVKGIARNIEPNNNEINLDVSQTIELSNILKDFDVVVNCIGILNKDAEDHPDKAIWFNSYFPHFLEAQTQNTSTKIIHISTDCVFSGKRGGYTENDIKDGEGFYAQSKALGEINNDKDLTIRTSIIGPELNKNGIGLFDWFMKQPIGGQLKGYTQAFWSGITTIELAAVIDRAVEDNLTGLIAIAPKEKIDKFSLIKLFNKKFRNDKMEIIPDAHYKVDKSLISIRKDFQYEVSDYDTMINEMKNWIEQNAIYNY